MKAWEKGAIYGVVWWILSFVLFYFGGLWRREDIISTFLSYTAALPFTLAANIYKIIYIEDAGIIALIISLPLSFVLAYLGISLHTSIEKRDIKRIIKATLIIGVIISGGSFPVLHAGYRDIKSDLFDIPLNAHVRTEVGFLGMQTANNPFSRPLYWRKNDATIYYIYDSPLYWWKDKSTYSNGSEKLLVRMAQEMSFSDGKHLLLKYVENKEIRDEISKIPIDEGININLNATYKGKKVTIQAQKHDMRKELSLFVK